MLACWRFLFLADQRLKTQPNKSHVRLCCFFSCKMFFTSKPRSDSLNLLSFPVTVIFLLISCFLDFTMAEVLSVSLLKKAGCCEELGGEREPSLQEGTEAVSFVSTNPKHSLRKCGAAVRWSKRDKIHARCYIRASHRHGGQTDPYCGGQEDLSSFSLYYSLTLLKVLFKHLTIIFNTILHADCGSFF